MSHLIQEKSHLLIVYYFFYNLGDDTSQTQSSLRDTPVIVGVPPIENFSPLVDNNFYDEAQKDINVICEQLYDQVVDNFDNERILVLQDKIRNREAVADIVKDQYPKTNEVIMKFVEDRREELMLN